MQSIKILYNNFLNVIKFAQLTWQKFHRISQENEELPRNFHKSVWTVDASQVLCDF